MAILVGKVKHLLLGGYHFDPNKAKTVLKHVHPLGQVYVDGGERSGYVASGYDWLEFPLKQLPALRKLKERNDTDCVHQERCRQDRLNYLRDWLRPGSTLYTVVVDSRRSGIGVAVKPLIVVSGVIRDISGTVSEVLDRDWHGRGAVWSNNASELVHRLSYALHGYKDKVRGEGKFRAGYSLREEAV